MFFLPIDLKKNLRTLFSLFGCFFISYNYDYHKNNYLRTLFRTLINIIQHSRSRKTIRGSIRTVQMTFSSQLENKIAPSGRFFQGLNRVLIKITHLSFNSKKKKARCLTSVIQAFSPGRPTAQRLLLITKQVINRIT